MWLYEDVFAGKCSWGDVVVPWQRAVAWWKQHTVECKLE